MAEEEGEGGKEHEDQEGPEGAKEGEGAEEGRARGGLGVDLTCREGDDDYEGEVWPNPYNPNPNPEPEP